MRASLAILLPLLCGAADPAFAAPESPTNPRFTGAPFLTVWQPEDYGGSAVNTCVLQHPRTGFIYVGNDAGVLEFDGARWRLIRLPENRGADGLAVDERGRIWVATPDLFCLLAPDAHGELRGVSAMDRLAPELRVFHAGRGALAGPGGVYFISAARLYFFPADGGPAQSWHMPGATGQAHDLWWMDGAPHLNLVSGGVVRFQAGQFTPVTPDTLDVYAARRDPAGSWRLATDLGLRRWSASAVHASAPAAGEPPPLGTDYANCAAFLADGRVAFGTGHSGLIVCDAAGRPLQRVDRALGLPSAKVNGVCTDTEGGVWLALTNGLARVQLGSPFALHNSAQGLEGTPLALLNYAGSLYVGHSGGLARRDPAGRFVPVPGINDFVNTLQELGGKLYATGQRLSLVSPDGAARRLAPTNHRGVVLLSTAPGTYLNGSPNGLWLAHFDGAHWARIDRHPQIREPTTAWLEAPPGVVWATNAETGVWRVDFRSGAVPGAPAKNFGPADGLPAGLRRDVPFFHLGASTVAFALGRLWRYDEASGRFGPETRIAGLPARGADGHLFDVSPDGSAWLQLSAPSHRLYRLVPDGPEHWQAKALATEELAPLETTDLDYDSDQRTVWLASAAGLVSLDLDWKAPAELPPLVVLLRRVASPHGDPLWIGDGFSQPAPLTLGPAHTALRFEFAAPAFAPDHRGQTHTLYRSRLEGLETRWTDWTPEPRRDFTSLSYGRFVFHVQASDLLERLSAETSLVLRITPPWWRAPWALAAEVLIAISLVAAVARHFAHRALQRRVQLLEAQAAVEAERLRLARDMHDDLGSGLGRVALLGSMALDQLEDRAATESTFRKITETAQALSRSTRDIIWAVNPHHDTVPELVEHLARLAEEILGEAGIRCAVTLPPDLPPAALGAGARHALLLAVKEALHNAIKYSGAATAEFSAAMEDGALVLTLRDHGRGFAPGECRGTGHGLRSIAGRLEAQGGTGQVTGTPGEGTTVRLTLPLPKKA